MLIAEKRRWYKLKRKFFDFLRFFNAFFDDLRAVNGYTEIKIETAPLATRPFTSSKSGVK
jgi:hypothetical protein